MNRRVVITGMGAVSPNGIGNTAFGESILAGKSGGIGIGLIEVYNLK